MLAHPGYQPAAYQPFAPTAVHHWGYQPEALSTPRCPGEPAINPRSYQPLVPRAVHHSGYQPEALSAQGLMGALLSTRGPINPGSGLGCIGRPINPLSYQPWVGPGVDRALGLIASPRG